MMNQKKNAEYTSLKNEIKEINQMIFNYALNSPSPELSVVKIYEERVIIINFQIKYLISVQKKDETLLINCFDCCYHEKIIVFLNENRKKKQKFFQISKLNYYQKKSNKLRIQLTFQIRSKIQEKRN